MSSHLITYRRAGFLMDDCSEEEVVEGEGVYLHQGRTTEVLRFEPGDVLGMLMRLQSSSGYTPLLREEDYNTGLSIFRNAPHDVITPRDTTNMSLILSLELCEFHSTQRNRYISSHNKGGRHLTAHVLVEFLLVILSLICSLGVDSPASNETYLNCSDVILPR